MLTTNFDITEQKMNNALARKKLSLSQRFLNGCSLLDFAVFAALPWMCLSFLWLGLDTPFAPLVSLFFLVAIFFFVTWPLFVFEGLRYALRKPGVRSFLKDELAAYEIVVNEPDV